ncbi:hypothetical protein [Streptomyces sp. NPDC002889]|uniref:hypothetical protein n=1 Tax=Streptomyces sp. NPDC002889 TaxID=3364669 RepID=UPI0036CEA11D
MFLAEQAAFADTRTPSTGRRSVLADGSDRDRFGIPRGAPISEPKAPGDPGHPLPVIAVAVGPDTDLQELGRIAEVTGGTGRRAAIPGRSRA